MKKGSHHKPESKEKNRNSHLGKPCAEKTKEINRTRFLTDNPMKKDNNRTKASERMKENNPMFDPASRASMIATKTGTTLPDEHIEKIRVGTKEALADPDVRKRMSESHEDIPRPQWVKDKIGKSNEGKVRNETTRKQISCTRRGITIDEFTGFVSFEPYCPKFTEELRIKVRNRFGNICVLCKKPSRQNLTRTGKHRALSVHHVYIEKLPCCETKIEEMDNIRKRLPENIAKFGEPNFSKEEIMYIRMMVPLCLHCHGTMNSEPDNISYEKSKYRKFFTDLILTKYEGKCF